MALSEQDITLTYQTLLDKCKMHKQVVLSSQTTQGDEPSPAQEEIATVDVLNSKPPYHIHYEYDDRQTLPNRDYNDDQDTPNSHHQICTKCNIIHRPQCKYPVYGIMCCRCYLENHWAVCHRPLTSITGRSTPDDSKYEDAENYN